MTILSAFAEFLTSDETLTDSVRQQGRQNLRKLIDGVYHGRRPRGAGPVCLTISRTGGLYVSAINAPARVKQPIIDVHVWAKDRELDNGQLQSGSVLVEEVFEALQDMIPQYRGALDSTHSAQTITPEAEPFESPIRPEDAEDNWVYHYIIPYMIGLNWTVPTGVN